VKPVPVSSLTTRASVAEQEEASIGSTSVRTNRLCAEGAEGLKESIGLEPTKKKGSACVVERPTKEDTACVAMRRIRIRGSDRLECVSAQARRIGVCRCEGSVCRIGSTEARKLTKRIRVSDQCELACVAVQGREEGSVCRIELDRVSIGVCHQVLNQ